MYIEPNGIIRILQNCPLDQDYKHTLYFTNESNQISYFQSLTKYTFTDEMYTRYGEGIIWVEIPADNIYDCNYLMFNNRSFGNKWFYGFITSINYTNNSVAEVRFVIDSIQTWFFDFQLHECFVEREHSLTDEPGDNIIPEKLELGEYVDSKVYRPTALESNDFCVIVAATFNNDSELTPVAGAYYNGVFQGTLFHKFKPSDPIDSLTNFLINVTQKAKADGIVDIFMMPEAYYSEPSNPEVPANKVQTLELEIPTSINGYTPKNKKLFTYPYNFIYVSNQNGIQANYNYEFFTNDTPTLDIQCDTSCDPTMILTPRYYSRPVDVSIPFNNADQKIILKGFPHCSYNINSFYNYLAQNQAQLATGAISSAVSVVSNVATANVGGLANDVTGIMSTLGQVYQASIAPNQARGSFSSSAFLAAGMLDYYITQRSIRAEFAKIIDDYFNMFGYATNRVKVPNISSRPHWNFVKTKMCIIRGNLPSDDEKIICDAFDRGITFWKNGNEIGDYSQYDNSPTEVI